MPDRTLRNIAGLCGIVGPIALTVYFRRPGLDELALRGASATHGTKAYTPAISQSNWPVVG